MNEQLKPLLPAMEEACRRHHVRRLELFGSATGADFDPAHSDLDFLVEFDPLPVGAYTEHYFSLLEELTELANRPVELVVAKAIRNPYFLEGVNRSRELVYAA